MIMIVAILIVLGLCFGSFSEALTWRLYQQSLPRKKRVAGDKELSMLHGRSMCPKCQHTLGVLDLLPLVSWLALRGKCRYCHKPIGWHSPALEVAMAAIFVASYAFWPFRFDHQGVFLLVCWLAALVGLVALILYDLRWMLLPNRVVFPLIGLGAVQVAVVTLFFHGGWHYLLHAALSLFFAGGLFYILFQLSDGKWIGGGDVKLGYGLGLLLADPWLALLMLFVASLLGIVGALPGLLTSRLKASSRIPFGPFLIMATIIVMLFGQSIVNWYKHSLLGL